MKINNRVIAITGAGRGLGEAMAIALATDGAQLALIDLNQADLDDTVEKCVSAGGSASTYITNVVDEQQVISTFDEIVRQQGSLSGLVNNAGVLRDAFLIKAKDGKVEAKMSLSDWQQVIDVNLTGTFLCGREAAEKMITAGEGGVIVNISSVARRGNMGQTNYSASKAGVASLVTVWAQELSRYGIRVAGIAPGLTETEMVAAMKPEAREKFAKMIPLQRLAVPQEIAHACKFIFENDYVTGRIIEVDGGVR